MRDTSHKVLMALVLSLTLLISACTSAEKAPEGERSDDGATEIGLTGGMCGGIVGFQCKSDKDYCAMSAGECVNVADASGICTPRPELCTADYRPVCGCDGETYSNACSAAGEGVNVAHSGKCRAG